MYHRYFGLTETPFSIAVDPRYLFMSERHRDALAHLLYGVDVGGGFILLTGEVGTGKTTLNRCLLEQLPETTDIALILNPALNAEQLLATACDELGIFCSPVEQSLKQLTDKLHQFLLENHAKGRNTVLLIDEAQHLQFEVLEQIRLLTNLETNTKKLLQIILVGQPELRSLLERPDLRQLAQRITARYQLEPLDLKETGAYIRHRLEVAGLPAGRTLFPAPIVKRIHKASGGIPRLINTLCDRMLLGAYGQQKNQVTRQLFKQAVVEVMGRENPTGRNASMPLKLAATLLVLAMAGVILLRLELPYQPHTAVAESRANEPTPQIEPVPVVVEELPDPPALEDSLVADESQAVEELMRWIGEEQPGDPCRDNLGALRCERLAAITWADLLAYNRPAVLAVATAAKLQRYATLVSVTDDSAQLLSGNRLQTVSLEQLGRLWTGDFVILWRPPPGYTAPFSRATAGRVVKWLAQQFAELDDQQALLAERQFTEALFERVKIFQQAEQLHVDGIVGFETLLKIYEQRGLDTTLAGHLLEQPDTTSQAGEG